MVGMHRRLSGLFAGREPELSRWAEVQRGFAAARPAVLVVAGEAGVGKTRLAEEFVRLAEQSGARALSGACLELGVQGLPFAPLADALRALIREVGEEQFLALAGDRAEFSRLLPELGRLPAEAGAGQARLFALTLRLVERLAAQRPLLLVVEDLHWADASTLDLLVFLVRSIRQAPVALVTTLRSDEPDSGGRLRNTLAELDRLAHVARLELPRLDRREVAEQMRGLLHAVPSPALVRRVYARSQGNPFFVEELVRTEGEEPAPTVAGADLPVRLREVLLARVRRLPPATRNVLHLAAVAGPEVSHALLTEMSGLDDIALTDAVRAAVDGHVLVADPIEAGYGFRHALQRDVLYADLLPAERVRWHARLAAALQDRPVLVRVGRAAADIARHWYAAGRDAEALAATLQAAEEAARQYAYAEQHQLLERAIDMTERLGERADAAGARLDRLYEVASTAAYEAGELQRARCLVEAALERIDRVAEPDRAARLLTQRGRLLRVLNLDGAVTSARQALTLVPTPSATRAAVLADLAFALQLPSVREREPDLVEALGLSAESLDLTRRFADGSPTETWARIVRGCVLVTRDDIHAGIDEFRLGLAAARQIQHDQLRGKAAIALSDALELAGRYREAVEVGREVLHHLERVGLFQMWGAAVTGNLGEALLRLGRWDEVDRTTAEAMDRDPPKVYATHLHQIRGDLAAARGDLAGATAHREAFRQLLVGDHPVVHEQLPLARLAAEIAIWQRSPEAAAAEVATAVRAVGRICAGQRAWPLLSIGARLAADAAERRRNVPTRSQGTSLAALAAQIRITAAELPARTAPARAHAALMTAELHRYTGRRNPEAWLAARMAAEELDDPYLLSYVLTRTAQNVDADRGTALDLLHHATGLADRLGAAPLRRAIAANVRRMRRLAPSRQRDPAHVFAFTPRERQIAELVGLGMTNLEIAGKLFVSAKTVEYHLSNIYAKLDIRTRQQLRAYVRPEMHPAT
jgi:DNA-binding CsgD family transcriptional regulator/tetratricopeptide (TPR) repeat protein